MNKRRTLRPFLMSVTLALLTGLAMPGFADDTEIYLKQVDEIKETNRPNLLLMLDNSASMTNVLQDEETGAIIQPPQRRIDVLKEALYSILENAHNVNMGIARFAALKNLKDPQNPPPVNAPIMFPVVSIDQNTNEIRGEEDDSMMDVSVAISNPNDDAEENIGTGKMRLNDKTLEMIQVIPETEPDGIREDIQIVTQQDDAVQRLEYGNRMQLSQKVIYLGTDLTPVQDKITGDTLVGLRFTELGIPKDAKIVSAKLELQCPSSETDIDPELRLEQVCGHEDDEENPLLIDVYGAALDGEPDVDLAGKSFRPDDAYITDNFSDWVRDEETQEPIVITQELKPLIDEETKKVQPGRTFDISGLESIVQVIINRDNWHYKNSLVLLLRRNPESPKKSRGFYSFDGFGIGNVPILRVYWQTESTTKNFISGWDKTKSVTVDPLDPGAVLAPLDATHHMAESTNRVGTTEIRLGREPANKDSAETKVGLFFPTLDIPTGAAITEAKLILTQQEESNNVNYSGKHDALTLEICAEKVPNAQSFKNLDERRVGIRYTRSIDTCFDWQLPANAPGVGNQIEIGTSIIKPILEEISAQSDWKMGNNVAFLLSRKASTSTNGFRRIVATKDPYYNKKQDTYKLRSSATFPEFEEILDVGNDVQKIQKMADYLEPPEGSTKKAFKEYLPQLKITFSAGLPKPDEVKNPDEDKQLVGLRFEGVDIPQGAKINSANLEFTSGISSSRPTNLTIKVEDTDDALSFTEDSGNISQRQTTSHAVYWDNVAGWKSGVSYTSKDLTPLVQALVNRSGWCGGAGGLAFIISGNSANPLRNAKSYDSSSISAPKLNITFDSKEINGNGCVNQNWSGQVAGSSDDAEEKISVTDDYGEVFINSKILELGIRDKMGKDRRLVGFRFKEVPVPPGGLITKAHLILTSVNIDGKDRPGSLKILGQKSGNPLPFMQTKYDLSLRPKTGEIMDWPIDEKWEMNTRYQSPNIAKVIQEIVNQSEWRTYNDLALFITGTGRHDVLPFEAGAASAAILRIQVKGSLGEGGEGNLMTVRRRLKRIVQKMEIPNSKTPIVDALYESAKYYLGKPLGDHYGKDRYEYVDYMVSHPGTYKEGSGKVKHRPLPDVDPTECNVNLDPLDEACAGEYIDLAPVYESPISSTCQTNHIVLLTDGLATRISSINNIKKLLSELGEPAKCMETYEDPNPNDPIDPDNFNLEVGAMEECGIDLADALVKDTDQRRGIMVHTIGFQLGKGWERTYEHNGRSVYKDDGDYFYKDDNELVDDTNSPVIPTGFEEVPSLTRNNKEAVKYLCRLASRRESGSNTVSGHPCPDKSFYPASTAEDLLTAFQEITAQALTMTTFFAAPGVSMNQFNDLKHENMVYYALFKSSINPLWEGNVKKYKLNDDGQIVDFNDNGIVNAEGLILETARSYWSPTADGADVLVGGAGELLHNNGARQILTYLGEAGPNKNHSIDLTRHNLNDLKDGAQKTLLYNALFSESGETGPEQQTESSSEAELEEQAEQLDDMLQWIQGTNRWNLADPLHSTPKVVTYGKQKNDEPISTLLVGTNDGLIHAIDAETGQEKWAFLPKDMLSKQPQMRENNNPTGRIYGIDGTATLWVNRIGGDAAINLEHGDFVKMFIGMRRGGRNLHALDVSENDKPKLMWILRGGKSPFEYLGQTWSSPQPTQVHDDYCHSVPSGNKCIVLLFGGGYEQAQDEKVTSDAKMGNAIYMVHANTGTLLWWASDTSSGADLEFVGMKYPIPSDLSLYDRDSDGNTDHIYVGDIGGQVWRIDLKPGAEEGGRLLKVPNQGSIQRTFFYPPAVKKLKGTAKTLVAIVSGTRPHPLYDGSQSRDQFYVFVDPINDAGTNWHDSEPLLNPDSDFRDVTKWQSEGQINLRDKDDTQGWYLDLCEAQLTCDDDNLWIGEKGNSATFVVNDIAYFATYTPSQEQNDSCSTQTDFGYSRLYGLNLLTGAPKPKDDDGQDSADDDDDDDPPPGYSSKEDAMQAKVAGNVSPNLVPGQINLCVFGFDTINCGTPPFQRVFWTQIE
jgi:type IV pilus assembly protein PilY1